MHSIKTPLRISSFASILQAFILGFLPFLSHLFRFCKYPGHWLSTWSFQISVCLCLLNHGFCLPDLMSDSWLTPILNVGMFLNILVIYYHFSSSTCVGHLTSGLDHTVVDFSCSHTVFQLLMAAAILSDHFNQTMRDPDCLQILLVT